MKYKKALCFIMICLMLIALCGCNINFNISFRKASPSDAKGAATVFMETVKKYEVYTLRKQLTEFPNTKEGYNLTYDLFSDTDYVKLFQAAYKDYSFSVQSCTENGDNATVVIHTKYPDLNAAYSTALYTVAAKVFEDEKLYQIFMDENSDVTGFVPQQMLEMYKHGEIELTENDFTVHLQKKDDAWLVCTDDAVRNLMTANLYTISSNASASLDTEK